MRIRDLGPVAVLAIVLAGCSSSASGSAAAATQPGSQATSGGQTSAAPTASPAGGGAPTAAPSQTSGPAASTAPSQATGGGASSDWLSKPCAILTEAEVAGVLHGAMVATPQERMETYVGECEYASAATGNIASVTLAEGPIAKAQFDQYSAAGQLGTKVDGLGVDAYYTTGEISIWKGDRGVGISVDQSDATDEASLKALAVALGKIAAGRF